MTHRQSTAQTELSLPERWPGHTGWGAGTHGHERLGIMLSETQSCMCDFPKHVTKNLICRMCDGAAGGICYRGACTWPLSQILWSFSSRSGTDEVCFGGGRGG